MKPEPEFKEWKKSFMRRDEMEETDPKEVKHIDEEIVGHVKELLENLLTRAETRGKLRASDHAKEKKLLASLSANPWLAHFEDEQNKYLFFDNAAVIRYPKAPKTPLAIQVQGDRPERPEAPVAFDASEDSGGKLESGFYVMEDGRIVITTPNDGSRIHIVSLANPGDTPLQYKC